jgi:hypothetical protein
VLDDPAQVSRLDPSTIEERWRTIGKPSSSYPIYILVVHTEPVTQSHGIEEGRIISARGQPGGSRSNMRKRNSAPLTAEQVAELERLAASPDAPIDTDDIPEVTDWRGAVRGKFYRPPSGNAGRTKQK